MKKKKSKMSLTKKLILGGMVAVGFLIAGFIIFLAMLANSLQVLGEAFGNVCEPSTPSLYEGFADVELPVSYDELVSECGGMQGQWHEARFTIDPDDLDDFLETTDIEQPLLSELPYRIYSTYWNALEDIPVSFLYGSKNVSSDWFEEIIVDTSDDERWIVYFTVLKG
ncbi:MAG: hypothetical protein AAFV93_18385 [Chloroflexota bacterium]